MKFRKKPVVIEAKQWDGSQEVYQWCAESMLSVSRNSDGKMHGLKLKTLEGGLNVSDGDWIIKGIKGEFYPCKPDIFEATYEAVE